MARPRNEITRVPFSTQIDERLLPLIAKRRKKTGETLAHFVEQAIREALEKSPVKGGMNDDEQ